MKAQYLVCALLLVVSSLVFAQTACPQGVLQERLNVVHLHW